MTRPADERPHNGSEQPGWVEAWLFDLVQQDVSLGVSIEFLLWPVERRVAFHTSLVRPGEPLVSLVELEAAAPKPPSLEVRAPGLWTDIGVQTPLEHMTVDLEAFAVALDEPADVFAGAYGIRLPLGGELEWESAAPIQAGSTADSYEIPCIVHGELLVGDEVLEIDGWGWRSHRWGVAAPTDRARIRGRTRSGIWFNESDIGRELTMEVLGAAPVPDPSLVRAHLHQHLARNDNGDAAWIRRVVT